MSEVSSRHMGIDALAGSVLRDVVYAGRSLIKNPGVTVVVVCSIALAIAANTTVFSLTNGLLFGSLPVDEPDRLTSVDEGESQPWLLYVDYRDQARLFESFSARFMIVPVSIGGGEPERIWGQLVTDNYFDVLGLQPALGRGFTPEEGRIGDPREVVILSDTLWRRRFGADPNVVGTAVLLNDRNFTVVGVMGRGFDGEDRGFVGEFWVPLPAAEIFLPKIIADDPFNDRDSSWLSVTARLKPGVSFKEAAAELTVIRDRGDEGFENDTRNRTPVTLSRAGGLPGGSAGFVRGLMVVLMIVVALVLLIACANVANILLARAAGRQKEIAIRLAMGAGRRRLIRQLLTESVLLALVAAVFGVGLTYLATRALSTARLPLPLPIVFDFTPDARVLLFTVALGVITGVVFGLAPALRAARTDLVTTLKDQAVGHGRMRRFGMRNILVVVQVMLSTALLVSAGLFLRSLQNASSVELGMKPENVLIMGFDPTLHSYSPERTKQLMSLLRQRAEAIPAVRAVSFTNMVPLSIGGNSGSFSVDSDSADESRRNADIYTVSTGYFETMGLTLIRGRDFNSDADDGRDVAIVNRQMSERLFPGEDPVGRRIANLRGTWEIVGIAANSKSRTLGEEQRSCVYLFLDGNPNAAVILLGLNILAKTSGDPNAVAGPLREEIRALDPNLAVFGVQTMQEHLNNALLIPRVSATLLGVFGTVGLTLAIIGLYGVMSYSVRGRTREIGIRMALGAQKETILKSMLGYGMSLAGVGLLIGLGGAFLVGRLSSAYLYGMSAADPVTFIAVPTLLIGVAFVASLVPAKRAASVSPSTALRYE